MYIMTDYWPKSLNDPLPKFPLLFEKLRPRNRSETPKGTIWWTKLLSFAFESDLVYDNYTDHDKIQNILNICVGNDMDYICTDLGHY